MNRKKNENPGCLTGLLELFLLKNVYNWGQEHLGAKRGGCCGCFMGIIFFIIFIALALKIVFNVDWTSISF
jgi:hypothetical protein